MWYMMASIYEMARQRIAGATIKAKEPKKPREKHEPTPEEIEERKARHRKYYKIRRTVKKGTPNRNGGERSIKSYITPA